MNHIVANPQDLTPAFVTELFLTSGYLSNGSVSGISIDAVRSTDLSVTASLDVTYSPDVSERLPRKLFLKLVGQQAPGSNAEVQFYHQVAPLLPNGIIPSCFAADYSDASGTSYLLLEDLSDTHVIDPRLDDIAWCQSEYTLSVARQIVDGFAHVHSLFWGDSQLGLSLGIRPEDDLLPSEEDIRGNFTYSSSQVDSFLTQFGECLGAIDQRIIRRVSQTYPDLLWSRISAETNLTLTHGDPHTLNVLVPKDPTRHQVSIVDWATYMQWIGVYDLAHHFPMYWHRTVRNAMEKDLVHRYHTQLCKHGVVGYDWNQCWYDYRLGVVGQVNRRIKHAPFNSAVGLWIFDNCLNAFKDLECEELICI